MDRKAFYNLEYGVFLVSSRSGERTGGCITNTCIQAASNPARLAIACINGNHTPGLIKESGLFTVSVLDRTVSFDTIRYFGMQSGHDVDKFASFAHETDENGVPYINKEANAVFSCKVVSSMDLGSHTLFIGEVLDAKVLGKEKSLTYAVYQSDVKPKNEAKKPDRRIIGWKCRICGYVYEGAQLPADYACPLCGHGPEDFEPVYEEDAPAKKIVGWKCRICGYVYEGAELPADYVCPLCGHGPEDFEPVYEEEKPVTKIIGWKCKICGYVHDGAELSADFRCPICDCGADEFEPIYG